MNIHEYQAKELLKHYGVPVPAGEVVYTDRRRRAGCRGARWGSLGRQGADPCGRSRQRRRRQGR